MSRTRQACSGLTLIQRQDSRWMMKPVHMMSLMQRLYIYIHMNTTMPMALLWRRAEAPICELWWWRVEENKLLYVLNYVLVAQATPFQMNSYIYSMCCPQQVLETIKELGSVEYVRSRLERLTAHELLAVKNVPAYLFTLLRWLLRPRLIQACRYISQHMKMHFMSQAAHISIQSKTRV